MGSGALVTATVCRYAPLLFVALQGTPKLGYEYYLSLWLVL